MNILKDTGKFLCGICRTGVGRNSIFCEGCSHWVHKACSSIKGKLRDNPTFQCPRYRGLARPIDGRPFNHIAIDNQNLEVTDRFCYLSDTICAEGGSLSSIMTCYRAAQCKFRELLPCRTFSLNTKGKDNSFEASCCTPVSVGCLEPRNALSCCVTREL